MEVLYHQRSENKGADQLRGYCETDLRLCFRIMQIVSFLMTWLIHGKPIEQLFSKSRPLNYLNLTE